MFDIDDVAIASLPARNSYSTACCDQDGCSILRINVLALMVFIPTPGKGIAPAANATLQLSTDRPQIRNWAVTSQRTLINSQHTFESSCLHFQRCQGGCTVNRSRGATLAARSFICRNSRHLRQLA